MWNRETHCLKSHPEDSLSQDLRGNCGGVWGCHTLWFNLIKARGEGGILHLLGWNSTSELFANQDTTISLNPGLNFSQSPQCHISARQTRCVMDRCELELLWDLCFWAWSRNFKSRIRSNLQPADQNLTLFNIKRLLQFKKTDSIGSVTLLDGVVCMYVRKTRA